MEARLASSAISASGGRVESDGTAVEEGDLSDVSVAESPMHSDFLVSPEEGEYSTLWLHLS